MTVLHLQSAYSFCLCFLGRNGGYSKQERIKMIIVLATRQIHKDQILQLERHEGCTLFVSGRFETL